MDVHNISIGLPQENFMILTQKKKGAWRLWDHFDLFIAFKLKYAVVYFKLEFLTCLFLMKNPQRT